MMRLVALFLLVFGLQVCGTAADCDCGYPVHRPHPCGHCEPHVVCVPVPGPQPGGQPEREAYREGAFAAPPRTGTVAGESQTIGLSGGGITIPSISLKLPTIQLPGLVRFRREAHVQLDAAEAPWVTSRRREYAIDAGPPIDGVLERARVSPEGERERAPREAEKERAPVAPCVPTPPPTCVTDHLHQLRENEQRMRQQLAELQHQLQELRAERAQQRPPAQAPACPPPTANPVCPTPAMDAACPPVQKAPDCVVPWEPLPAPQPQHRSYLPPQGQAPHPPQAQQPHPQSSQLHSPSNAAGAYLPEPQQPQLSHWRYGGGQAAGFVTAPSSPYADTASLYAQPSHRLPATGTRHAANAEANARPVAAEAHSRAPGPRAMAQVSPAMLSTVEPARFPKLQQARFSYESEPPAREVPRQLPPVQKR